MVPSHWRNTPSSGPIPLAGDTIGLGWSIRMGEPAPLYCSLATAALWVGSDALTWRRGGRARRRYELAKLPPPPRPPQSMS